MIDRPLRPTDDADVDAAFRVMAAAETAVIGEPDTSRAETQAYLAGSDVDLVSSRLVFADDEPVGLLVVEIDVPGREVVLDAYSVALCADELLPSLVAVGVQRADEIAEEHGGSWHAEAGAFANDESYRAALAGHGFQVARRFWRMRIDLAEWHRDPGPAPAGVEVVPAATPELERALHAVDTEAFTEHWGEVSRDFEPWLQRRLDRSGGDRSQWWLALVDGRPAGLLLGDRAREDLGEGFVGVVGVVPWARGRGVGAWLLRLAFADAAARGLGTVALNVDSENTTGATRLYQKVGMRPVRVIDAWQRPVRLGESEGSASGGRAGA